METRPGRATAKTNCPRMQTSKHESKSPSGAEALRLSASHLHLSLDLSKIPGGGFLLPAPNRVAFNAHGADIVDAFGSWRTAVMPTIYAFVCDITGGAGLSLGPNPGWTPATGSFRADPPTGHGCQAHRERGRLPAAASAPPSPK